MSDQPQQPGDAAPVSVGRRRPVDGGEHAGRQRPPRAPAPASLRRRAFRRAKAGEGRAAGEAGRGARRWATPGGRRPTDGRTTGRASTPPPQGPTPPTRTGSSRPAVTRPRQPLFAADEGDRLRGEWESVQAAFVDDPRAAVQRANALVSEVVQNLTESFTSAQSHLEQQWSQGEDVSTEDLRQALHRYRSFFERLLRL